MKRIIKMLIPFLLISFYSTSQKKVLIYATIDQWNENLNANFQSKLKSNFNKKTFKKKADFIVITKSVKELRPDSVLIDMLIEEHNPDYLISIGLMDSVTEQKTTTKPNPISYNYNVAPIIRAFAPSVTNTETIQRKRYFVQLMDLEQNIELDKQAFIYDGTNLNSELLQYRKFLIENQLIQ